MTLTPNDTFLEAILVKIEDNSCVDNFIPPYCSGIKNEKNLFLPKTLNICFVLSFGYTVLFPYVDSK